jgi:hypothetical protein
VKPLDMRRPSIEALRRDPPRTSMLVKELGHAQLTAIV